MLLPSGPQIAIVDDSFEQVKPIIDAFQQRSVGCLYFDAGIGKDSHPKEPIESIETVFLDLFFQEGLREFDADLCAQWIDSIVPSKHNFNLIIWTKDSNFVDPLLEVLEKIDKKPIFFVPAKKNDYRSSENSFNIPKLFDELTESYKLFSPPKIKNVYGEIVDIQDDHVLVNCLLSNDRPTFQVRRFEREVIESSMSMEIGKHLLIRITTDPGKKTFEFINESEDISNKFEQIDYFSEFKDSPFIQDPQTKNENNI